VGCLWGGAWGVAKLCCSAISCSPPSRLLIPCAPPQPYVIHGHVNTSLTSSSSGARRNGQFVSFFFHGHSCFYTTGRLLDMLWWRPTSSYMLNNMSLSLWR
jgi:hypothetical protein